MSWKEACVVTERARFVLEWKRRWEEAEGRIDVAELCRVFGVSRQTGYVWIRRFREANYDVRALDDRSRRPRTSPTAVPEAIQDLVVLARKAFPRWGPRKLRAWLVGRYPGRELPSASTMANILKRRGLTVPKRRRRRQRRATSTAPFAPATAPNAVWCIDFKGKFRTKDGCWCTVLTILDASSRYCISCEIVERANLRHVQHVLDSAFRAYGTPVAMRSDNGPPFAAQGPAGLSQLAVWLLRLGIRVERIQPGKPQQNGRQERFHRTLELEAATPPSANARAQQRRIDIFRRVYNEERPHEALANRRPADLYVPSSSRYPRSVIPVPNSGFGHVERVERNGTIRWRRRRVFISSALYGEPVSVELDGERRWAVLYGEILLGHLLDDHLDRGLIPAPRPRRTNAVEVSGMSLG